jgi:hypothetical protein
MISALLVAVNAIAFSNQYALLIRDNRAYLQLTQVFDIALKKYSSDTSSCFNQRLFIPLLFIQ